jgi:acyl carrier protein
VSSFPLASLQAVFSEALSIGVDRVIDGLKYNSISEWDSVGHMALVSALEARFDVMLDTSDIIDISSVAKAREILGRHGVSFE